MPEVTGDPPAVTVAVKMIGVLYGTLVEEIPKVMVVGVVAYARTPAKIAEKNNSSWKARLPARGPVKENNLAERRDFGEVIRVPLRHAGQFVTRA